MISPVSQLAWICTGPTVPGTVWDGLAYAWPYLVLALIAAGFAVTAFRTIKPALPRYLVVSGLALVIVGALAVANFSYGIGVDCKSSEPSEYERRLNAEGR